MESTRSIRRFAVKIIFQIKLIVFELAVRKTMLPIWIFRESADQANKLCTTESEQILNVNS